MIPSKGLRTAAFGLLALLTLWMAAATVMEKLFGTSVAFRWAYGSTGFVLCWLLMAMAAVAWIVRCRLYRRPLTLLLHGAFALILLGALVTRVWGMQGSVHLRQEDETAVRSFTLSDGTEHPFPFSLKLEEFRLAYYPGTAAPMDYISRFLLLDGTTVSKGEVSMNHVYRYRHYRFYQSQYDSDGRGTTLSVSYDPWGIGITYTGYGLLAVSFLLFFIEKQSRFRRLLCHSSLKRTAALCGTLLLVPAGIRAADAPRALPRETAEAFGHLYVYHNDRICPLQTLAKDFTVKLCGQSTYCGLTAEQVLTGWFFYYDSWKEEPCFRVKNREVRQLLGISGEYASLTDFVGSGGYKLDEHAWSSVSPSGQRAFNETNEKFSLASMAATGSLWKLFPYRASTDTPSADGEKLTWYSLADRLPSGMPQEEQIFVRRSMNYVGELVARRDFGQAEELLGKIRHYQEHAADDWLPSRFRITAERCYNRLNNSRPLAMACLTLGMLAFGCNLACLLKRRSIPRVLTVMLATLLGGLFLFLCFLLALRGIISGHIPMSNGHEAMQTMAACTALFALCLHRRMSMAVPFGYLLCGFSLLVSMMGESNPQITQLMPVLSSPLLSFHVMTVMAAYALLGFTMLNGVTALALYALRRGCREEEKQLQRLSQLLLYPAVFLLAVGIFLGAIWANVSWGRYWGWDPKEVWALVTLLVYTLALHEGSLPRFRQPLFFHIYVTGAFFCVLITYFGVNFLLGGMHSYA